MARSSARSQTEKQHQTTAIAVQVINYSQAIEIGSSVPFAIKEICQKVFILSGSFLFPASTYGIKKFIAFYYYS